MARQVAGCHPSGAFRRKHGSSERVSVFKMVFSDRASISIGGVVFE
jgi:hypothetical protein